MGLLIFLLSPVLVRIVLGEQFDSAIPVLRVLAFVLPLGALSYALHTQWMLPLGMDRPLVIIITGVGFLNVVLALILAPHYAHIGMAWAVVLSELVLTMSSIYVWLRWRGSSR